MPKLCAAFVTSLLVACASSPLPDTREAAEYNDKIVSSAQDTLDIVSVAYAKADASVSFLCEGPLTDPLPVCARLLDAKAKADASLETAEHMLAEYRETSKHTNAVLEAISDAGDHVAHLIELVKAAQ